MEPIVRIELTENPINKTAVVTFSTEEAWNNAADIRNGTATGIPYITFEQDFWLLDGSFKFMPTSDFSSVHLGYMSENLTDAMGVFVNQTDKPIIKVRFDGLRSVDKITLCGFRETYDFVSQVKVSYYKTDVLEHEITVYPNDVTFEFTESVTNIDEVRFTLETTNKPYRRARLTSILFDDIVELRGKNIVSCNVKKELSPLSTELPYGTFSGMMISDDTSIFDVTDSRSLLSNMTDRMPIEVYYDDGGQIEFIERYYLTGYENISENELQLEGMDLIGLMEEIPYRGDQWKTDANFYTVVQRVLSFVPAIKTITVDASLTTVQMRGYLKPGKVRDALMQVLFAAGASIKIINGDTAVISPQAFQDLSKPLSAEFGLADIGLRERSLKTKPPVTRVELTAHNYLQSSTQVKLFEGTMTPGTHVIKFESPSHVVDSGVIGATLIESIPAQVTISVTTTGTVTINGYEYKDVSIIQGLDLVADPSVRPNIIAINDATMVSNSSVDSVLYRMQTYFSQKFIQSWRSFNPVMHDVGELISVRTLNGKKLIGVTEYLSMDLAKGRICDFRASGIVLDTGATGTKLIKIGALGSVAPTYFVYPSNTPQSYNVQLLPGYADDYGIEVSINGVKTLYLQQSASFTLPSTNQFTDVAISFPLASKPITVGTGMTVSPTRFKYPVAATQYFNVTNTAADTWKYFIRIKINSASTDYDIGQKVFALENTTSAMTVEVSRIMKSTKSFTITGDPLVTSGVFYIPVSGTQVLQHTANIFYDGAYGEVKTATYKWYVNGVLKSQQDLVATSTFNLSNANSQTVVRLEVSNRVAPDGNPGGGGSGSGGGSSYTPWSAYIYGSSIMRDAPSFNGNYVAGWGANSGYVEVTAQTGEWYYGTITSNPVFPQTVGLTGWVHQSVIANLSANPN